MSEAILRPMRADDVPLAERLSAHAFLAVDERTQRRNDPDPEIRAADRAARWLARTEHFLRTDPGGCWVAEAPDGSMAGFATSIVRDKTWILATYAVRPGLQGVGIGRPLLEAAVQHGRWCLRGMLSSSSDPRAVRRYRLAGFSLHPQMHLRGRVDRAALPVVEKVREGTAGDTDLMNSVDRRTRDAAHGPDHDHLQATCRALVADSSSGEGYAYVDSRGLLCLLAATNRATASRLLWAVLADGPEETTVSHLTSANEWALDVGLAARLDLHQEGYLALRGMKPPTPYVHHGALL